MLGTYGYGSSFLGTSVMTHSVVIIRLDTETAFSNANLTTLVGSNIPYSNILTNFEL